MVYILVALGVFIIAVGIAYASELKKRTKNEVKEQ